MIGEYILLAILGYILYRLIFNLILPIVRSTRMVREQFAQMQDDLHRPGQTGPKPAPNPAKGSAGNHAAPNWDKMGDYIDFEEVK